MSDSGPILNLNNTSSNDAKEEDYHLRYFSPDDLENLSNFQRIENNYLEFKPQGEYSYLKEQALNIGEMGLTDRQIVAVSLVFFGGLKKNLAAKIMNISCQALRGHIEAGLKKISKILK
ncbi:MAG: hypothetical protein H8E32_11010 [Nitrospinae bacterium]|nr:hypothetical protein [Nitrospinota bacterium]